MGALKTYNLLKIETYIHQVEIEINAYDLNYDYTVIIALE